MDIGKRLKLLRKNTLNLTQSKFGEQIGFKATAIGQMESGDRNVTDRTILLICKEFNVNEEWLRNGTGDMFIEPDTFSLDQYLKSKNATDFEIELVKSFFEIPDDSRKEFLNRLKKYVISNFNENDLVATKEETFEEKNKRELEAYALELEAEAKGEISSALEKHEGA